MRPTMLQQNNNNNYPCLNMSGSSREMLQKLSRTSLPFPSRAELGLGDLPLIRGLRAWALFSRNRRKACGLLGRGPADPAGRGGPRPADVYLSGEWGLGLPLGLDARQAEIGALVTVASLKTSEGGGKTQTQCLFLRTEKGGHLYSTAKPAGGDWLKGKTANGGGGDSAESGPNRVKVRSGRRWRKSSSTAQRERQQRSGECPEGELQERQEEPDKGGLDRNQLLPPQLDPRRSRCSHRTCHQKTSLSTSDRKQEADSCEERTKKEFSAPPEGSVCSPDPQTDRNHFEVEPDSGFERKGDLDDRRCHFQESNPTEDQTNTVNQELNPHKEACFKEELEEKGGSSLLLSENGETRSGLEEVEDSHGEAGADPRTSEANLAPSLPPLASMATGLPCLEAEREEKEEEAVGVVAADEEKRRNSGELEEKCEEERISKVAAEEQRTEEEEEFGVFMQAEEAPAWSEGVNMCASSPGESAESGCGSSLSTPVGEDPSSQQSEASWAAFPLQRLDTGVGERQWWPTSAVETRKDRLSTNHNVASVFAVAFPAPPRSDLCDLSTIPTLTQLLRGKANQDQSLLESFHDLNKMIGQRYKRGSSVSRQLLLKTLHLQETDTEVQTAPWTTNRRLSPGLPSSNQHALSGKRRLSYDYNRNMAE
ncbi:uncharacterized protein LOC101164736 isoform X3 [Oryzias latipes]|uniref:uncharacterized protein LOC101164736 isoform X3 n=1 Tax=Oryzias latipes TaxID=8090 RepID=UPI0009D965F7|nr:uncharacterized protein LOC101164736 isoform X3 [Oryzias latipes]